jgi:DHA2 family multidrug resistance protein-like MFS transporter
MSDAQFEGMAPDLLERARETLGAAIEVAQPLAAQTRVQVEATAREAFASAVRIASLVSAALGIVAALVCVMFMKKRAAEL